MPAIVFPDPDRLKEENARLREENLDLRDRLTVRASGAPRLVDECYAFDGEEGLFCAACFDVRHRKVRVSALKGPFSVFGKFSCPECKTNFAKS